MQTEDMLSADVIHRHHADGLNVVLGACILIIGLCVFAAVILLSQHLQRHGNGSDSVTANSETIRRTAKASVAKSQYRPLSEPFRRHSVVEQLPPPPDPVTDSLRASSTSLSQLPDSLILQDIPAPSTFIRPNSFRASRRSMDRHFAASERPATLPVAAQAPAPISASVHAPSDVAPASSGPGPSSGSIPTPLDTIDIHLLSRIDQALTSGIMRPQEASRILKSYGCDLEEIVAAAGSPPRDAAAGPISRADVPQLRVRSAHLPAPAVPSPARQPPTSLQSPTHVPEAHVRSSPIAVPAASPIRATGVATPPAAAATPNAGVTIDDALLLKIDMALASGVMRPEQATQLLKSYGCDLEELLREELGDSEVVRRSNSGLANRPPSGGMLG